MNCISSEPAQCCMEMLTFWFNSDSDHTCRGMVVALEEIKILNNILKIEEEIEALQEYVMILHSKPWARCMVLLMHVITYT